MNHLLWKIMVKGSTSISFLTQHVQFDPPSASQPVTLRTNTVHLGFGPRFLEVQKQLHLVLGWSISARWMLVLER